MADKYPYPSATHVQQVITQLRKTFPPQVTAETLKKWKIASNNETRVINWLKFMKIIDEEGKKTPDAGRVLNIHGDDEFANEFGSLVEAPTVTCSHISARIPGRLTETD